MRFRDTRTGAVYQPRDKTVERMMAANPAFVALDADRPKVAAPTDLAALTVAQLRALCADRGVDAPKRATKAQLIALLDG